jgi:hypothetical protein
VGAIATTGAADTVLDTFRRLPDALAGAADDGKIN